MPQQMASSRAAKEFANNRRFKTTRNSTKNEQIEIVDEGVHQDCYDDLAEDPEPRHKFLHGKSINLVQNMSFNPGENSNLVEEFEANDD